MPERLSKGASGQESLDLPHTVFSKGSDGKGLERSKLHHEKQPGTLGIGTQHT